MNKNNGFEFINYSKLSPIEQKKYYNEIYLFLIKLNLEYPCFLNWYHKLFGSEFSLTQGREIILCRSGKTLAGVSILKKSAEEKKICTIRVDKRFQRLSIGKNLMELSFEWLESDKPLITVRKSMQSEFHNLFQYYGFNLEDQKRGYYRYFSTELSYNGGLPERSIIIRKFEVIELYSVLLEFVNQGLYNSNRIMEWYFHDCEQQNMAFKPI